MLQGLFLPTANGRNAEVCAEKEADWAPASVAKVQDIARMHSVNILLRETEEADRLRKTLFGGKSLRHKDLSTYDLDEEAIAERWALGF